MPVKKSEVVNAIKPNTFKQENINVADTNSLTEYNKPDNKVPYINYRNKQYSLEKGGTRMAFDPSEFAQEDLFSLLNSDDSMSLEIKVLYDGTKVRNNPNEAANCILITKQNDAFEVTKQWRGWFYIQSAKGWIKSSQVMVTKVIKPYDPEHDVDFGDEDILSPESVYDAAAIINALISSKHKLPSYTISHSHKRPDGTIEETLLSVLLDQLINSRDLVDKLNDKVGSMPKIPSLPEGTRGKVTLVNVYDSKTGKNALEWRFVDFEDVKNIPELDLIDKEEF